MHMYIYIVVYCLNLVFWNMGIFVIYENFLGVNQLIIVFDVFKTIDKT